MVHLLNRAFDHKPWRLPLFFLANSPGIVLPPAERMVRFALGKGCLYSALLQGADRIHGKSALNNKPLYRAKHTLLVFSLALASCRTVPPAANPTPEVIPMRLITSQATAPLLYDLVKAYQPENAILAWDIQVGDGDALLEWLQQGRAPYAVVGYLPPTAGLTPDTLWSTPLGTYGVAFVVHPENPIQALSVAQIRAILQGRITNWQEVGGSDVPLQLVVRDLAGGEGALVQTLLLGDRTLWQSARLAASGTDVVALVAESEGTIGFVSTGYVTDETVRPLAVEGILPTVAALTEGTYPIRAPILAIGRAEPGNDAYRAFFAWVQSPAGQAIVQRYYGGLQ
jgi:phosphate transport system substrate-binding protein